MEVNKYSLDVLLFPITGLADDDDMVERYMGYSYDDKVISQLVKEFIQPHVLNYSEELLKLTRNTLGYYLVNEGVDFSRVFNSCLPPFDLSDDQINKFFEVIWSCCFDAELESYKNVDVQFKHDLDESQNIFYL